MEEFHLVSVIRPAHLWSQSSLTVLRYILFLPAAMLVGIFVPGIVLEINFFLESILDQYSSALGFLYFASFLAGSAGGLSLLYSGIKIAPQQNAIVLYLLIAGSILVNALGGFGTLTNNSAPTYQIGAALVVSLFSLVFSIGPAVSMLKEKKEVDV